MTKPRRGMIGTGKRKGYVANIYSTVPRAYLMDVVSIMNASTCPQHAIEWLQAHHAPRIPDERRHSIENIARENQRDLMCKNVEENTSTN